VKQKRYDELLEYYNELCASYNPDFVNFIPMDRWNPHITLTATMTSLKKQAKDFIEATAQALTAIEDMPHSAEILAEYRQSLNLSAAISTVTARHNRIEEEKRRQKERKLREQRRIEEQILSPMQEMEEETPILAPPVVEALMPLMPPVIVKTKESSELAEDDIKTLKFSVTAPIWKLRELKKFLDDGGYDYE